MRARPVLALAAGILATLLVAAPGAAARAGGSDPALAQRLQWSLERIGAPQAWPKASGAGTTIAIVDSGADLTHEDLKSKIIGSVTCIGADGDPRRCRPGGGDDDGHGTHVAGIAAAATGNGKGVAGVAPGASLLIVRALEHSCDVLGECTASGTASDVIAAIRWAADHGADVINLSLGSATQAVLGPSFAVAVREAWTAGAIPVVAAGNGFVLESGFADEPAVVVAATTREDTEASYSNGVGQARWGVAAPGGSSGDTKSSCMTGGRPVGVLSSYWLAKEHNQYACLAGTSMSAPHVSGALAILRGAGLAPQQAVDRLLSTARDLGPKGRDSTFGAGRIDLAKATASLPAPKGAQTTSTTSAPSSTSATVTSSSTSTTTQGATVSTSEPPTRLVDDGVAAPADFDPRPDDDSGTPAGLVAAAIAMVLATGTASGVALIRVRRGV